MNYRSDIDGLRAVAVLSVVLFHAGFPWFPGGYVGVDVFFVISGYLITRLIHEQIQRDEFSVLRFYERRVRRIFPALFVMILASCAAAVIWFMPVDLAAFSRSMGAAALSVSNFQFWSETGYFDGPSDLKPLLHTWTLAVEEQFYILFPLALFAVNRRAPRHLKACIAIGAALTLALCLLATTTSPKAAFFLLPFRAWELLFGSLLAVGAVPVIRGRWLRELAASFGLMLIIAPVFLYSKDTSFPGAAALAPTLGAALLIHAGEGDTAVSRVLRLRPLVFIGLISYSVYLWHWPLFVFTRYYIPGELAESAAAALAAASIIIGWASWRWVERPFRAPAQRSASRLVLGAGAAAIAVTVLLSAAGLLTEGLPQRLTPEAQRYAAMLDKVKYFDIYDRGGCFLDYGQSVGEYDMKRCAVYPGSPGGAVNVLVYGDSFAAHLYPGLSKDSRVAARQYTATSCRPFESGDARCDAIYERFFEDVLPSSGADVVIVSALWTPYYKSLGEPEFSRRLKAALNRIQASGKKVILFGQSPTFYRPVPYVMAIQGLSQDETVSLPPRDSSILNAALGRVAKETSAAFFDPYRVACSNGNCLAVSSGEPFHWDFGHMTLAGSKYYGSALVDRILALSQKKLQ